MKDLINSRVKFREEFRPFAPAVIEECCSQIFDLKRSSPFMTVAANVKEEWRNKLKAVTHVDGTARVQTVNPDQNPLFYKLIFEFGNITGVPVVLNTSFNLMGEPIVETPMNAISTFSASGLDSLIIDKYIVTKK
jgi:carbamoyltransferase